MQLLMLIALFAIALLGLSGIASCRNSLLTENIDDTLDNPGDLNLVGTVGKKTLYIQKAEFSWAESLDFCHSVGLELASIESQAENELVFKYLQGLPHPSVPKDLWLGGSDFFSEGTYRWLRSGQEFTYTNWNTTDEATLGLNANCLYLYSIDSFWYGDSCSVSTGKIPLCEELAE